MRKVLLGVEVENVTTEIRGIVIGHVTYLEGTQAWLVQPRMNKNGVVDPIVEWSSAYVKYVGEGVHVNPAKHVGFAAGGLHNAT